MLAGTGEGPPLAAAVLQRGWRLRLSLVSAAAALSYRDLERQWPGRLELHTGALGGVEAIRAVLEQARGLGDPFALVIDATHPFAQRISHDLSSACCAARVHLLRLERPAQPIGTATVLPDLPGLQQLALEAVPLLLALGGRQLAAAVAHTPSALHHARVLPSPAALQLALAAGVHSTRIAALRPTTSFAVEAALLRRWRISTVVCRQSGGWIEAGWRRVCAQAGCRLLLLQRPAEPPACEPLPLAALLAKLDGLQALG